MTHGSGSAGALVYGRKHAPEDTVSTNSRSAETPRPRRTRIHARHFALALIVALPSCGGDGDGGSGPAAVWSLGATETVTAVANEMTGDTISTTTVLCPDGFVGVGYEGYEGQTFPAQRTLGQLRLLCAELRADGTLGTLAVTDPFGSGTDVRFSTECAPDSFALTVLVGARGESGVLQPLSNPTRVIRNTQGQCLRPADVAAGVANDASVRTTTTVGGNGGNAAVLPYALFCPHGSAVTGLKGQENTNWGLVAAIGLICREVRDG